MTGPKPIIATGLIRLDTTNAGPLTHAINLNCEYDPAGGGLSILDRFGVSLTAVSAATEFITLAKAIAAATVTFTIMTLYEYTGGVYVPRSSHSFGVAGTGGGTYFPAQESTFTFRDTSYNLDKIVLTEFNQGLSGHDAFATMQSAEQALVTDILTPGAGHVGNWYTSKAGVPINNSLFRTFGINRRLRRKLGLA